MRTDPFGYLIVETFEYQYEQFSKPWDGPGDFYGIPKKGVPASHVRKRYRGIDRYPLDPYPDKDVEEFGDLVALRREHDAQRLLAELEASERVYNNYIKAAEDARAVFDLLTRPSNFELLWARDHLFDEPPPPGTSLLGYEPSYFWPDHFSAVADCFFFPRWHGPDKDGTAFRAHFDSLNEDGLFNTPAGALDYTEYYRSFDWTETKDPWILTEVHSVR